MNASTLKYSVIFSLVLGLTAPVLAQDGNDAAGANEPAIADSVSQENPRHRRFDDLVIEMVSIKSSDGADEATLTAYLCNLRPAEVYAAIDWGQPLGMKEIGYIQSGEVKAVSLTCKTDDIPYDRPILAQVYNMEAHQLETTDTAELHGKNAIRIAILFESATFEKANARFGSAVRRMRQSFDDFNEVLEIGSAPAVAGLKRAAVTDRFRIESFDLYKRADYVDDVNRPPLFDHHPAYDLVIAIDADGPLSGYQPAQRSIGQNFHSKELGKGLWSDFGEQTLWQDLLRSRGAIDFDQYVIPPRALKGYNVSKIDLPQHWASSLMNSPFQNVEVSALTSAIVNAGDGGSTDQDVQQWIPSQLTLRILGPNGKPLVGAGVRCYRARSDKDAPDGGQRVAPDRQPDVSATTSANGTIEINRDDLAGESASDQPSRWLLVEIEDTASKQTRYGVICGLWLNAAYAAGQKQNAMYELHFNDLSMGP